MTTHKVQLREIAVEQLIPGRFQPRQHFDEQKLEELAEAIKTTQGLLQPIIVREIHPDQFEIIAGERRWRAAMLANFPTVTCLIRRWNDQESLEAAIIENVARADLNPIEEANGYQKLIDDFGYIHEEIAAAVGKSRAKITNSLRMLRLDVRVQECLVAGTLSEGHGKIIAGLPLQQQFEFAQKVVKNAWSVRKTETEVRKLLSPSEHPKENKDPNIQVLERALSDHIGCQVNINWEDLQGKMEINFHNLEVLQGLFAKMGFDYSEER